MPFLSKIFKPKIQKSVKKNIQALKKPQPKVKEAYSKILAREILITETFVNRLKKSTDRPIVVIGNGGTGKPYTWTIKKQPGIYVKNINYPSSGFNRERIIDAKVKLNLLMENIKKNIEQKTNKKPIIVFVDASREPRMTSAFVGHKDIGFLEKKDSLLSFFENNKKNVAKVGYDWSLKNGTKYLPKAENFKNTDVILLNPIREANKTKNFSAYHDDKPGFKNKTFKKYVTKRTDILKYNLFKDKK
jgi:hypothetical protein